jgi:endonuclease YncB( thermonuclease family)
MRAMVFTIVLLIHGVADAASLTGRVIRVTDGDTLVVLGEGNAQHRTNLLGVDAPEHGQDYGVKARQHLSDLVAGRFVVVEYSDSDRYGYGQIAGKVMAGDRDICLEQIRAGLAWYCMECGRGLSEADRQRYAEAEARAREAGRGLWNNPQAEPPWEYRSGETQRGE